MSLSFCLAAAAASACKGLDAGGLECVQEDPISPADSAFCVGSCRRLVLDDTESVSDAVAGIDSAARSIAPVAASAASTAAATAS